MRIPNVFMSTVVVGVPQVVSVLKGKAGKAIFQGDQALRELYRTERVMENSLTQLSESSSKVKILIQQQFSKLSEILQHRQQMLVSRVEQEVRESVCEREERERRGREGRGRQGKRRKGGSTLFNPSGLSSPFLFIHGTPIIQTPMGPDPNVLINGVSTFQGLTAHTYWN